MRVEFKRKLLKIRQSNFYSKQFSEFMYCLRNRHMVERFKPWFYSLIQTNILIENMVLDLTLIHYFGADNNFSVHIDNKKKGMLVLGEGQHKGLKVPQ